MRLPRDAELPAHLVTLIRLQFLHGLLVVAVATGIWLPAPAVAHGWLSLVPLLVAIFLLLPSGLYLGAEVQRGEATLTPAVLLLWLLASATPFVPALIAALLMIVAVMLLFLMEKVAAIRKHWPEAWLRGRRQHMQFQMVSLASVVFWLFSRDNQLLLNLGLEG